MAKYDFFWTEDYRKKMLDMFEGTDIGNKLLAAELFDDSIKDLKYESFQPINFIACQGTTSKNYRVFLPTCARYANPERYEYHCDIGEGEDGPEVWNANLNGEPLIVNELEDFIHL